VTKFLIALALSTALTGGAYAGDLNQRGGLKDPVERQGRLPEPEVQQERAISWTGFYIGGRLGYGNANHDLTVQQYNGDYCWDVDGDGVNPHAPLFADNPWLGSEDSIKTEGHVDNRQEDGSCNGFADGGLTGPYSTHDPVPHGNGTNWDEDDHAEVAASSRNVAHLDGLNSRGIIGGAQIGADYQMGRFVAGVFGSYDFASMESEGSIADFASFKVEKGDEWSLGARIGFLATPRTMVYALAAYTQTDYKFSAIVGEDSGSKSVDFDGVSVGGGIEVALTHNVFIGAEYVHTFYDEEVIFDTGASTVGGFGTRVVDELDEDKIMATLKVKLNSDLSKVLD
jgi:outer membrane immunogenic protein